MVNLEGGVCFPLKVSAIIGLLNETFFLCKIGLLLLGFGGVFLLKALSDLNESVCGLASGPGSLLLLISQVFSARTVEASRIVERLGG